MPKNMFHHESIAVLICASVMHQYTGCIRIGLEQGSTANDAQNGVIVYSGHPKQSDLTLGPYICLGLTAVCHRMSGLLLTILAAFLVQALSNPELQCKEAQYIFHDGRDLCETIFGDAFTYEPNEDLGYTMWFFDKVNPNDAVTERLKQDPNSPASKYNNSHCHLQSLHKDGPPGKNPGSMTECHPWQDRSCCYWDTVKSAETINNLYGPGYRYDRCGPLTPACERFWVQEDCFYECDPNIGIFRKHPNDHTYDESQGHNPWEIYKMPIKASYCDAWFRACKHDMFCGKGEGNHIQCGAVPIHESESKDPDTTGGDTAGGAGGASNGEGADVVINMYNAGSNAGGTCSN